MSMLWFGKICPLGWDGHHAITGNACEGRIQPCYIWGLMESMHVVNFSPNCYYYIFYFIITAFFSIITMYFSLLSQHFFFLKCKFCKERGPLTLRGCRTKHILMTKLGIMTTVYCIPTDKLCKHEWLLGFIVFGCHPMFW